MVRPIILASLLALAACGSSNHNCAAPVACGHGSVQTCVSGDHGHCSYRTSDGDTIDCASCGDCSAAAQKVATWCMGGGVGGNGTAGGSGSGGGNGTGGAVAQSSECKLLLSCAAAYDAQYFTQLVPVYGPTGSCWADAATAASCTQACIKTVDGIAMRTSAPECHAPWFDMALPPPGPDMALPPTCLPQNATCMSLTECCSSFCVAGVCL